MTSSTTDKVRNARRLGSSGASLGILLLAVLLTACNDGTRLEFHGGGLYYTDNVTEAEAQKLGKFLVDIEFFDLRRKSVQLDRGDSAYRLRVVVPSGPPERAGDLSGFRMLRARVASEVFEDQPVELHFCDRWFQTTHVLQPDGRLIVTGSDGLR